MILDFADLVAAEGEPGQVVALDEEARRLTLAGERALEAGSLVERGRKRGETNPGQTR
jgi:hypothetical protein